jgi:hypothetical protein
MLILIGMIGILAGTFRKTIMPIHRSYGMQAYNPPRPFSLKHGFIRAISAAIKRALEAAEETPFSR